MNTDPVWLGCVVDTEVVANAPERYLVSGMGDAMATWYEAKVCIANPNGLNVAGGKPALAACAMGEICASTLYADGLDSIADLFPEPKSTRPLLLAKPDVGSKLR